MGKKNKSRSEKPIEPEKLDGFAVKSSDTANDSSTMKLPFLGSSAHVDPALASLFEKSAGPVKAPSFPINGATASTKGIRKQKDQQQDVIEEANAEEVDDAEQGDESPDSDEVMQDASEDSSQDLNEVTPTSEEETSELRSRKRKRGTDNDNLEDSYMRRIAKEEEKEREKRRTEKAKRQKVENQEEDDEQSMNDSDEDKSTDENEEITTIPVHESLAGEAEDKEVEKSNRTVFLGNVSTQAIKSKAAKKTLMRHLGSFLVTLPESTGPHRVESIRFRSTAFASGGRVPKRAAFARKEVMDETTPSTNAYAVYSTMQAARKAPAALNGTVVLDRHLRVDSVAHPSEINHKRCIFVGNLDFVDKETDPDDEQAEKKKKKNTGAADIEEGLWRTFNAHTTDSKKENGSSKGSVEFVRVVRDRTTRIGKGFAYVQFYDQNCVEEALLLDGKKFPPMLPRKLRIVRAKKVKKRREGPASDGAAGEARKTLQGRATRLFGRAGAAKLKNGEGSGKPLIFEGHRASESSAIKVKTKSRGSKGKPKNRSSRRAAAYRASGGKTAKAGK